MFYTNISHELRTPINLITAPLDEIMNEYKDLPIDLFNKLDFVHKNSMKLISIINQELDYRRSESSFLPLAIKNYDITDTIKRIYELFGSTSGKLNKYELINNIEGKEIYCDISYIEKILTNLISNAIKFTPEGEEVEITVDEISNKLVLSVKNTGTNISKKEIQNIFERFYKANELSSGQGIGLAIVKNLANKHHGDVTVESKNNTTVFTVTIPCVKEEYLPTEFTEEDYNRIIDVKNTIDLSIVNTDYKKDENLDDIKSKDTKYKIIIFHKENNGMGIYLKNSLKPNYNVSNIDSYDEVCTLSQGNNIDLLIIDIDSNDTNIYIKFCNQIKKNIKTSHIPIITLLNQYDKETELEVIKSGADTVILKPFDIKILKAKIENLIMQKNRIFSHVSGELNPQYSKAAINKTDKEFIEKVINIIEKNLSNEEFNTNELAEELNIGRSNLYLKMEEILGESPATFIRKLRLEKACEYLRDGEFRVSEISDLVGFSSASYFSSCFKKYIGCLPKEYAQKFNMEE